MASLDGMRDRTITHQRHAKTSQRAGWRVDGPCPAGCFQSIRKVHDFLTVGRRRAVQQAGAIALELPQSIIRNSRKPYLVKRDRMLST